MTLSEGTIAYIYMFFFLMIRLFIVIVLDRLAAAGASLGHVDMAGQCPLVHAARHGRLSVVGYLLACDWIVPASESKAKNSALEIGREEAAQQAVVAAASQGHEAVVEYLLDMAEVIVDRPDTLIGETALTISAANGSTATVSALLARGANPIAVNTKGLSPLMLAAREGHWGTAERLLQGLFFSFLALPEIVIKWYVMYSILSIMHKISYTVVELFRR